MSAASPITTGARAADAGAVMPASAFQRWPLSDAARVESGRILGGLVYGWMEDGAALPDGLAAVPAAVLLQQQVCADVWLASGPVEAGQTGSARWRHDGRHLFGAIDLPEDGSGLEALARRAYGDLFACLARTGFAHLHRLWNYLPRINEDGGGLERYRQFNAGRQQAFLDAGQAAFEGAPAACALGLHRGGLILRFLAAKVPPHPIENPRQTPAWRYPADYGPRAPTFSRAAVVRQPDGTKHLFVSGTASIVGHATVHVDDLQAQLEETLRNLDAVLAEANHHGGGGFTLGGSDAVVYVRHPEDAPGLRDQLAAAFGEQSPFLRRALFLHADICRRDLLLEIETHMSIADRPAAAVAPPPEAADTHRTASLPDLDDPTR